MEAFMTKKVDWATHLQAIEAEGISIKDYAAREGLPMSQNRCPMNHVAICPLSHGLAAA